MRKFTCVFLSAMLLCGWITLSQAATSPRFFVMGQVQKPAAYNLTKGMRLIDAIILAGGMTLKPDEARLSVCRGNRLLQINVSKLFGASAASSQNLLLQAGDAVVVGHSTTAAKPTPQPVQKKLPERRHFQFNGTDVYVVPLSKHATKQKALKSGKQR